MASTQLKDLLENGGNPEQLSVDQYHRMIASGILPEGSPVELLDGVLVRKDRAKAGDDLMTVGTLHTWAVQNLARVLGDLSARRCHLRLQQPITILPAHEPEPGGAIVEGQIDDYRQAHPGPEHVLCIVEVADSSLQHDRTTKQRIYADAGIRQYVVVNLVENVVEVFNASQGGKAQYDPPAVLRRGQVVSIHLGDDAMQVPAERFLP